MNAFSKAYQPVITARDLRTAHRQVVLKQPTHDIHARLGSKEPLKGQRITRSNSKV